MIAYVFDDQTTCAAKLAAAENAMRDIAASHGFTVLPDGRVLGRNLETGQPDPDAIAERWSVPMQTSDGRWCFPSVRDAFPTTYQTIEAFAELPEPVDVELPSIPSDDC
jgi:hypothetical protein